MPGEDGRYDGMRDKDGKPDWGGPHRERAVRRARRTVRWGARRTRRHARGPNAPTGPDALETAGTVSGVDASSLGVGDSAAGAVALAAAGRAAAPQGATSWESPGQRRFRDDLWAGLRAIVMSRPLRAVTAATCVASFGLGMLTPVAVPLGAAHGHPTGSL